VAHGRQISVLGRQVLTEKGYDFMKRQVMVDKRTYLVEYEKKDGRISLSVDGRQYLVDASTVAGGFCSFLVDGCSHDAFISREQEHYFVVVAGNTMDVVFHDPRARRQEDEPSHSATASRQIIRAPMTGRIVRIQVAAGNLVRDGQGLVVLEAMKMENELKSQGIGEVREILVKESDVVVPGQHLIIIE
jgi:biotin carboxyl carrier protein